MLSDIRAHQVICIFGIPRGLDYKADVDWLCQFADIRNNARKTQLSEFLKSESSRLTFRHEPGRALVTLIKRPSLDYYEREISWQLKHSTSGQMTVIFCGHGHEGKFQLNKDLWCSGSELRNVFDKQPVQHFPPMAIFFNCCDGISLVASCLGQTVEQTIKTLDLFVTKHNEALKGLAAYLLSKPKLNQAELQSLNNLLFDTLLNHSPALSWDRSCFPAPVKDGQLFIALWPLSVGDLVFDGALSLLHRRR